MTALSVDVREWERLHNELGRISEEAEKVNAFITQHARKTWEVGSQCVVELGCVV
jgi:hypothetical protein